MIFSLLYICTTTTSFSFRECVKFSRKRFSVEIFIARKSHQRLVFPLLFFTLKQTFYFIFTRA